jgi:hypothetical protein
MANPQEIYLLERYPSLDYFCELRDTWADMVKHLETCLDRFMQNLPKTIVRGLCPSSQMRSGAIVSYQISGRLCKI